MTKACLDKEPLFSSIHTSSSFGIRININTSNQPQDKMSGGLSIYLVHTPKQNKRVRINTNQQAFMLSVLKSVSDRMSVAFLSLILFYLFSILLNSILLARHSVGWSLDKMSGGL